MTGPQWSGDHSQVFVDGAWRPTSDNRDYWWDGASWQPITSAAPAPKSNRIRNLWLGIIGGFFCCGPVSLICIWMMPWKRPAKIIGTVLVCLLWVPASVNGVIQSQKTAEVTTNPSPSPKVAAAPTSSSPAASPSPKPPPPPPPSPRGPQVLLDQSGSGSKTTEKFTVPNDWDLGWSYDCSSFGSSGNFVVSVYNGDGSPSDNLSVNQLGTSGSDIEHYHHGGSVYLEVNSECSWHLTVKG